MYTMIIFFVAHNAYTAKYFSWSSVVLNTSAELDSNILFLIYIRWKVVLLYV